MIRTLLVEDSTVMAPILRDLLVRDGGFAVNHADHLVSALKALCIAEYDLVLLDLNLPDSTGLQTVARVHAAMPDLPIVVLTVDADDTLGAAAVSEGADDFLVKGQTEERAILRAARQAVIRRHRQQDGRAHRGADASARLHRDRDLVPICSHCKKIRDKTGDWSEVERFISTRSPVDLSHGICPDCVDLYFHEFFRDGENGKADTTSG